MSWAMIGAATITTGGALLAGGGGGRNSSQNSSGWSSGSSSSTGTGSTTQSGRNMPVVPEGWEALLMGMRPGAGGLSPAQLTALTGLQGRLGAGSAALANPTYYLSQFADSPATTLEQLYAKYPDMYQRPADVTATMVNAGTGAAFMDPYRNPFEEQVVNSTIADLERARGRSRTAAANRLVAEGAFGGSASALENALIEDDFNRAVGSTVGALRSGNFQFSAGQGQTDASRALAGATANQGAALTAATGNRDASQARQMFDVNSANGNEARRLQAVQGWGNLIGQGQALDTAALLNLMSAGGVGYNQDLTWLRQFLPLFGSESSATGETTSNQTGTQSGSQTGSGYTQGPGPSFGSMVGNFGNLLTGLGRMGWNPFGGTGGSDAGLYPEFTNYNPWSWAGQQISGAY